MNILNKEELRKQIREGKEISLDGILEEFKSLLRESLQTASEEELTSHLGYEKHQESENTNYRNGHSKKSLKTKYGQIDVAIPRDREGTFEPNACQIYSKSFSIFCKLFNSAPNDLIFAFIKLFLIS